MNVRNSIIPNGEKLTDRQFSIQWNHMDWSKAEKLVNRLQVRITKAVKEKKWYLVRRLEYLLTHSFSAKLLAIRRIVTNKGKRTAGVDGERWNTSEAKMKAALGLTDKGYKAKPLRRVYIDKPGKKKKRSLGIPTMRDRGMQALYALALNPIAEATADRNSYGFRKYRSTKDACGQIFNCLSKKTSAQWILEGDIKGCFDNINHQWLIDNVPVDVSILKQFIKAGYVYNRRLNPTIAGTPQGGIISPTLANMALDGIESLLANRYHTNKSGKVNISYNSNKVNFVRYADDFIVTADSKETAEEIEKIVQGFLMERGLELSNEKTRITHIDDGFDFLGWSFRKYNGKLLIKPSKQSINDVVRKISDIIKKGKTWTQEGLIRTLNPIIIGWANYHRSIVAKDSFSKLDYLVWSMLWQWAKRRHPNKSSRWIAAKYWHQNGTRKWVFCTSQDRLKLFSDTKIIRHIKVKSDKNPYLDMEYFETRKGRQSIRCYH